MPPYYHTPENALKRANEFCELGKEDEAVECLYNCLKNCKSRILKCVHEVIINKLLELCVEKKNSQKAKDALFSYRNLCQGINIKSWEDSISKYLQLAESKVKSAQETFQSLILDVNSLDQNITPEILLKSVSIEDNQDRTARIVLLPWIKFMWECYRNCLDLLKHVQSVKLYYAVAKNAFNFCVEFCRKSELRKLCNALKLHSVYMQNKFINDNEIHLICLDVGFVELESTIKMEMWQDAFKTVNNIHALMNTSKNLQHSKIMVHYYNEISQISWKGKEYLFHAAANLCYFMALREQKKNFNSNEIVKLTTRLILSILAVPPTSTNLKIDHVVETDVKSIHRKNKLLSSLLHLSKGPTRASLIKDVVQLNILQYLPEEILNLFQTLDGKLDKIFPSILMSVNFIKNWSNKEFDKYIPLIQKVFIGMLLTLLPNFYTNINMGRLLTLTGITQMDELEVILVESARRYELPIRIDHRNMQIHFSTDFNIFKEEKKYDELALEYSQPQPDNHLRYLIHMHSALKHAVRQIDPESEKNEHKTEAENIAHYYIKENESFRKSLLQRKKVIEKYKESLKKSRLKKEEDKKRLIAEKLLQYETAEKERLLRETEERKLQRLRQEQEEIKRKILLERMETFKKSVLGSQTVESLEFENIDCLDPQIFFSKQVEQLNKEKKQLDLRLRRQERNFDHFERAKRIEEIPLLIEKHEKQREIDIKEWNKAVKEKIDAAHMKREQEVRQKNRVLKIKEELYNFLELVKKRNSEVYRDEMKQFLKMLAEEKQKKLKERAEKRKQKRKEEWVRQQKFKAHEKTELKRQDISKGETKQHIAQKIVKNQNIKYVAPPIKPRSTTIEDKSENISSRKQEIYSVKYKTNKYSYSTKIPEETDLSASTSYCKRVYKNDMIEIEQTEVYKKKALLFSEFSSYSHTKPKQNQRSDVYIASENKKRTSISSQESSQETLLTWRSPWARKDSYPNQHNRYSKEIPRQNITIMRRENRSEASNFPTNNKGSDFQQETVPGSENERNNIKYSCTPWAKSQRQIHKK